MILRQYDAAIEQLTDPNQDHQRLLTRAFFGFHVQLICFPLRKKKRVTKSLEEKAETVTEMLAAVVVLALDGVYGTLMVGISLQERNKEIVRIRLTGLAVSLVILLLGIQAYFPDDQDLVELGAESNFGAPLFDNKGRVIGHLVALDDKPMQEDVAPALG